MSNIYLSMRSTETGSGFGEESGHHRSLYVDSGSGEGLAEGMAHWQRFREAVEAEFAAALSRLGSRG